MGSQFTSIVCVLVLIWLEPLSHVRAARVVPLFLASEKLRLAFVVMALVQFIASKSVSTGRAFEFKHAGKELPKDVLPWNFDCSEGHYELVEFPRLVTYVVGHHFTVSIYEYFAFGALLPLLLGFGK